MEKTVFDTADGVLRTKKSLLRVQTCLNKKNKKYFEVIFGQCKFQKMHILLQHRVSQLDDGMILIVLSRVTVSLLAMRCETLRGQLDFMGC